MISISVILVTYNNEGTIRACLESLHRFIPSRVRLFLIIIDNNSSDATVRIIRENYEKSGYGEQIQLIENDSNILFAPAVNQGLRLAKGDYIMLLNPDTVITEGMIDNLLNELERNESIGLAGPQYVNRDGLVEQSCRRFPTYTMLLWEITGLSKIFPRSPVFAAWKMGDFDHRTTVEVEQPMGACLLVRRTYAQKVGEMDERFPMFFNDVDWSRRFKENGFYNYFISGAKIIHHAGHSVYQRRAKMIMSSHWSFYRYLAKYNRKYWEIPLNYLFIPLLLTAACLRILFWILFRDGKRI